MLSSSEEVGVLLLDVGGIREHDSGKVTCRSRAVDRIGVAVPSEERQPAGMIDVCVGEHHGVDFTNVNGQHTVFCPRLAAPPLKHPAVQQDRSAADFENVTRPRDFSRRTGKSDLHRSAFAIARTFEDDRDPVIVLRHHRRTPATTTALVEQIGERIFVVARMPRESEHDCLVFFHAREVSSFRHMDTTPAFPTLRVVSHPLVQHKLSLLRDRATPTKIFKELVDEIATLIAYEATSELTLEPAPVETPLESTMGQRVSGKKLTLVPILRAGLGMVEGVARLVPAARVGHIGLYRDHDTLEPVDYYFKVPGDAAERDFFLLDPMLATGGSAVAAVASLKRAGAARIRFLCLVAAPEGVRRLADAHPDVVVYCASLDRELNEHGYILPGLGDAGDRVFGTR